MRKLLFALLAFVLFSSHDMFLKLDGYFLPSGEAATIMLYNGTFDRSENVIDRSRMLDVSLVGNGNRTAVDTSQWTERDSATLLTFTTGEPGTYVAGVSTRARNIALDAAAFNRYLEHDGVVDMLAARRAENLLETDAVEKYSKHVKTIFQVGDARTDDWQTELGYPIEFVPLSNPYGLHPGDELSVKLLRDGRPLADQLVYVGSDGAGHDHGGEEHSHGDDPAHSHSHEHDAADEHDHPHGDDDHDHPHDHDADTDDDHTHTAGTTQLRTDAKGELTFTVAHDGVWYLRTIHLVDSGEEGLTHESNWATLTFQVDHDRSHAGGAHAHDHGGGAHAHDHGAGEHTHEHEGGVPGYVFWLGSLLLLGGLFLYFNRKA